MKYILIGGSGFIGQHFIKKLGDSIIANYDIDEGINNTAFTKCDILLKSDLNKIKLPVKEDITVIHLAAVHFDFQRKFHETNVEGTKNVLFFLSKHSNIKKYVFFSSVATYGDSEKGKNEHDKQIPYNDYGKSKLLAENLIRKWQLNNNIQTIIIRPAVVYGEYNFGNVFNLIKQIKSGLFAIIGSGNNIKSIAYAPNLVESVNFVLKNVKDPLFIYNYADYPQLKISEQSNIISEILNKKPPFKIPILLTKLITKPIDFFELLLKKDLKVNSMRVEKFTTSTFFHSDLIREKGFKQKFTTNESLKRTCEWILKTNINLLRKKWYNKSSKL